MKFLVLLFNFDYSPKKMQGEKDRSSERYSVDTNLKVGYFPGGPVVKNLPCNGGYADSIPGWGTKIPRATGNYQVMPALNKTGCRDINK